MRGFLLSLRNAIDTMSGAMFITFWMALAFGAIQNGMWGQPMGFLVGFCLVNYAAFTVFSVMVDSWLEVTESKKEDELERQFITFCEPALEALPEDRRDEFRKRLLETCDYYSERKSLRQRLDEWWLKTNLRGE